jgi:hypothetical protein
VSGCPLRIWPATGRVDLLPGVLPGYNGTAHLEIFARAGRAPQVLPAPTDAFRLTIVALPLPSDTS